MHPRVVEAKVDTPLLPFLHHLIFASLLISRSVPNRGQALSSEYPSTIVKNVSQKEEGKRRSVVALRLARPCGLLYYPVKW
jgi:hypothetical protein